MTWEVRDTPAYEGARTIFSDVSVSQAVTRARLELLRDEIVNLIQALNR